jgi:hypothetical protein
MSVMLTRVFLAAPLTSSCAVAQEPTGSQDASIQALLKEVHALRIALERTNEIGPKNQIGYPSIIRPFRSTPVPWVVNPKVNFNSQSTPITRFRGFLKALSSATRALLLTT